MSQDLELCDPGTLGPGLLEPGQERLATNPLVFHNPYATGNGQDQCAGAKFTGSRQSKKFTCFSFLISALQLLFLWPLHSVLIRLLCSRMGIASIVGIHMHNSYIGRAQTKKVKKNFISACEQKHAPGGSRFDFRFRFRDRLTDLCRRLRVECCTHSGTHQWPVPFHVPSLINNVYSMGLDLPIRLVRG